MLKYISLYYNNFHFMNIIYNFCFYWLQVVLLDSAICWNLQHDGGLVQLAVIGDRPLSIAKNMVQVPLVLVPNNDVALYSNVHISSVSPTEPLVTCKLNHYSLVRKLVIRNNIFICEFCIIDKLPSCCLK